MNNYKMRELTEKVSQLENLRRPITDDSVKSQTNRIKELLDQVFGDKLSIAAVEAAVEVLKGRERNISRIIIPYLLDDVGLSEYTTCEGMRVSVSDIVRGSVSKGNAQSVQQQLTSRYEDSGMSFEEADAASREDLAWHVESSSPAARLALADLPHEEKFRPHHMRISRMVREWLDAGDSIPEGISWTSYRETKLRKKKKEETI